jgi:hypothetical protein
MSRGRGTCAVVAVVALWLVPSASAADPSTIYADYSVDGKLSCKYSRADLRGALLGATMDQYGDPYTVAGLKKAIRKQLAPGGCARRASSSSGFWWTAIVLGIPALMVFVAGGWAARHARFWSSQ